MRDRLWILAGLVAFVATIAVPFWYRPTPAKDLSKLPQLVLPVSQKQCVAPVSYMRASHMVLLMNWRQEAVRDANRGYVAFNGKVYQKSLTGTCLGCHNKAQFCDRCHTYAGVSGPYCWDCHNAPPSKAVAVSAKGKESASSALYMAQGLSPRLLSELRLGQTSPSSGSRP